MAGLVPAIHAFTVAKTGMPGTVPGTAARDHAHDGRLHAKRDPDLRRAHPEISQLTRRLDVMRWGHAMIRPRAGFLWGGATMGQLLSVPLFIVGVMLVAFALRRRQPVYP